MVIFLYRGFSSGVGCYCGFQSFSEFMPGKLTQMTQNDKPIVVYSTCPDEATAKMIATALVSRRLAACVNIIPGMISIYRWDGAMTSDQEVVLIIKARAGLVEKIISEIKHRHPYDLPSIMVLPVVSGCKEFLSWLMQETGAPTSSET